jgi:GT2 family glycosyltransferase
MKPSLLFVIPTYGAFDYATLAVTSALRNTTHFDPAVLVVDDATPESGRKALPTLVAAIEKIKAERGNCVRVHTFAENGGLTRSWNYGLEEGIEKRFDYVCVTNSDVYFPHNWDTDIAAALGQYALVGPVTNAPGSETQQFVKRYSILYDKKRLTDPEAIARIQQELLNGKNITKPGTLNGFCMIAKTQTWRDNRFDATTVFRPRNDFNSRGDPNPTPLMTLNEYELQHRWHSRGLQSGICVRSFVVHYRAVSRGAGYKRGDWLRVF